MRTKLLIIIITAIIFWVMLNYVPYGTYVIFPINLFVTFLHELGHAIFAIITGGHVHVVHIQSTGAGYADISEGFRPLILLGGYIGSALFGNLLLYIGLYKPKTSIFALCIIIAMLLFTAIWWFSSVFTSILLFAFSAGAIVMSKKSKSSVANLLIVIGTASLINIIMDYNSGPSSDLAKFTQLVPIFPQAVWAVVWLIIVIVITWHTIKKALKKAK